MMNYQNNLSFTGDSVVSLPDNSYKKFEDIEVGDYILGGSLINNCIEPVRVVTIIKCKCNNNLAKLIKLTNKCKISPYHPITKELVNGSWKYPIYLGEIEENDCDYLYNIVLQDNYHYFKIDKNYLAISLGNELSENFTNKDRILYHPFYSTNKVKETLKNFPDYPYIKISSSMIHRDPNTNIVCNIY